MMLMARERSWEEKRADNNSGVAQGRLLLITLAYIYISPRETISANNPRSNYSYYVTQTKKFC